MNLEFSGQEVIGAPKDRVWKFINDPSSIASCLPDVQEVRVRDEHSFDAIVQVAVGPVRGKFTFKILLEPQPDGEHMNMKIGGGGFGSVVDLLAAADVKGDAESTTLDWHGSATMRGPLASLGGRALDAQAKHVISTTFANVKNRLTGAVA